MFLEKLNKVYTLLIVCQFSSEFVCFPRFVTNLFRSLVRNSLQFFFPAFFLFYVQSNQRLSLTSLPLVRLSLKLI